MSEIETRQGRLLFVSPVLPDPRGNGLAMRAAMFLEGLSRRYAITLVVVPLFGAGRAAAGSFADTLCERVIMLERQPGRGHIRILARFDGMPALAREAIEYRKRAANLEGQRFDVLHCFRLYTAPLALELMRRLAAIPALLQLDIDDIESSTHGRLAELYRLNGMREEAEAEAEQARRYAKAERRLLPRFHRLYVCSEGDATRIQPLVRGEVPVVPNAVALPEKPLEPLTTHPFTFLFVGTQGFYPNEDAVSWFCNEVLPMIKARTRQPCLVRIVGRGYSPVIAQLAGLAGVRVVGDVEDLEREYADADAVIVPVRTGGGMRIKVLEAFAYQRPVVATSAAVEGIDAAPGEHFLLGDTARAFATKCLYLMQDHDLGRKLAMNAFKLVSERYAWDAVTASITSRP